MTRTTIFQECSSDSKNNLFQKIVIKAMEMTPDVPFPSSLRPTDRDKPRRRMIVQ